MWSFQVFFDYRPLLVNSYSHRVGEDPVKGLRPLTEPCVRVRTRLLITIQANL